jgi:hypothetical protein
MKMVFKLAGRGGGLERVVGVLWVGGIREPVDSSSSSSSSSSTSCRSRESHK